MEGVGVSAWFVLDVLIMLVTQVGTGYNWRGVLAACTRALCVRYFV